MITVENNGATVTVRRDDGAPLMKQGLLPDGTYGIKTVISKKRIYTMDNVIRHHTFSKPHLMKIMGES